MSHDKEIDALSKVYEHLKGLNKGQIKRIMDWLGDKYDLEKKPGLKARPRAVESSPPPGPSPLETVEPARQPVKKRPGPPPGKTGAAIKEPLEDEIDVFKKYETFEDFFKKSKAKTKSDKILLAAAYLQENKKINGFTSSEVNILINKIGLYVPNISSSLYVILSKKPVLIKQKGRAISGKGPRRKYVVTEEGLRVARDCIIK